VNIVYQSFEGRFSDSPRALYAALAGAGEHAHTWLAHADHRGAFPPGVRTVEYGSAASIRALEDADLLVANTHTDLVWDKPPGAVYLQTWHGTPLKRVHWDVLWAPAGRLERLSRDVERWDYLVSPNSFSTPLLRSAFRYGGPVLETGYPRNDVLSARGAAELRRRVRDQLGIGDETTAVLYAPTWRDDAVFVEGGKDFAVHLDMHAFADRLGGDYRLLLRLHYLVERRLPAAAGGSVQDVSAYPDIAELYLAADVLVTDYSSSMFDFAVTGKPMLFYTYDLDDYHGRLRGFYFDFAPEAPGPLVTTTADLLDALADLPGVRAAYGARYARFRERFCHLEDGGATARVLERVLADMAVRGADLEATG
jgi:CDP-glycerol glycerophosphotransferase